MRRRQAEITQEVVNMACQWQGIEVLKKNMAGGKFVEITINIARCVATLLSIHKHVYRLIMKMKISTVLINSNMGCQDQLYKVLKKDMAGGNFVKTIKTLQDA